MNDRFEEQKLTLTFIALSSASSSASGPLSESFSVKDSGATGFKLKKELIKSNKLAITQLTGSTYSNVRGLDRCHEKDILDYSPTFVREGYYKKDQNLSQNVHNNKFYPPN